MDERIAQVAYLFMFLSALLWLLILGEWITNNWYRLTSWWWDYRRRPLVNPRGARRAR